MRKLICFVAFLCLISCDKKEQKYSKELKAIFKSHGGIEVWKNVKTLSFSSNDKDVTFDLISGKKVVSGKDFSFGFDGKNYWSTEKSTIKNPKAYLQNLSEVILIPFSLAEKQQTGFDKDSTVLRFDEIQVFYNPDTNLIDIVKFKNRLVEYEVWQDVIGFKLPNKVNIDAEIINFDNLQLSQAIFDDRFYQKPN